MYVSYRGYFYKSGLKSIHSNIHSFILNGCWLLIEYSQQLMLPLLNVP